MMLSLRPSGCPATIQFIFALNNAIFRNPRGITFGYAARD